MTLFSHGNNNNNKSKCFSDKLELFTSECRISVLSKTKFYSSGDFCLLGEGGAILFPEMIIYTELQPCLEVA